jgi:hypothetical protein
MTLIAQAECCTMLGIDPKTLRNWLKCADLSFAAHPTDARLKCLTEAQVQQLASLHQRPLPLIPTAPLPSAAEADLRQTMLHLQAQVASLQEQLTHLALEVLRERELRSEQRLRALEALVPPAAKPHSSSSAQDKTTAGALPATPPAPASPSRPAPVRTGSRALPLIASTATGTYVIICPTRGELSFAPDSPEWFDWLATLSSFRFVGKLGRLSASRNRGRPCWMAYRRIHGHCYSYGLGNTKRLTIAHLEQMAAILQSHVPSC